MSRQFVKKPGYMARACVAWVIYNAILTFTLGVVVYLVSGYLDRWFVMLPLLIGVVVSEWVIMSETIAPIISDWIKQEQWIDDAK